MTALPVRRPRRQRNVKPALSERRIRMKPSLFMSTHPGAVVKKTTFANIVARVLNPGSETLEENYFLWPVVGSTPAAPQGHPGASRLDEVFFINPGASDEKRARWPKRGRKPWIIAKYDAWQEQNAQPPLWYIFLTLQRALIEAPSSPGAGFSRLYDRRWWRL